MQSLGQSTAKLIACGVRPRYEDPQPGQAPCSEELCSLPRTSVALGARAAVPSTAPCFGRELLLQKPRVGGRGFLHTRCIAGPPLVHGCVSPGSAQPRVAGARLGPVAPSPVRELRELGGK